MNEANDNSNGARIDALEAKVDAVLTGLAAQIANLSMSAQDAQPGVCIHTGVDPSAFVVADCAADASSSAAASSSEGMDACSASVGTTATSHPKAFDLECVAEAGEGEDGEETKAYYLRRCWVMRGGVSEHIKDLEVSGLGTSAAGSDSSTTGTIVALKIKLYPSVEYGAEAYSSVGTLTAAQQGDQYYIVPLWLITGEDESEWVDLRTQAYIQVFDPIG